jgi:predicted transcriptional regulator
MRPANPKVIKVVKSKVAEYIRETMRDRGVDIASLSHAAGVCPDSIHVILDGGEYQFSDLLAIFQSLRIHIQFETSSVNANLSPEFLN